MTSIGNKIIGFYNNQNESCDIDNAIYVKLELLGRAKELEQNLGGKEEFKCEKCGLVIYRDINASRNICIKNIQGNGIETEEYVAKIYDMARII